MKLTSLFCFLSAVVLGIAGNLEGRIKLIEFKNNSNLVFNECFTDGTPYKAILDAKQSILIDQQGAVIETTDGTLQIILEDAHRSGYHRPHWKYHVWLKSKTGFPFLKDNKILYAVIFYDGDGEVKLRIDPHGRLDVKGAYDVKDILYPWNEGTIGRGNPYNQIKGTEIDNNGVRYFDFDGFVSWGYRSLYLECDDTVTDDGSISDEVTKPYIGN